MYETNFFYRLDFNTTFKDAFADTLQTNRTHTQGTKYMELLVITLWTKHCVCI